MKVFLVSFVLKVYFESSFFTKDSCNCFISIFNETCFDKSFYADHHVKVKFYSTNQNIQNDIDSIL